MFVKKEKLEEAKTQLEAMEKERRSFAMELGLKFDSDYKTITDKIKELKSQKIKPTNQDKKASEDKKKPVPVIQIKKDNKKGDIVDWKEIDQLEHNQEYDQKIGDDHPDNSDWKEIDNLEHNKDYDSEEYYIATKSKTG